MRLIDADALERNWNYVRFPCVGENIAAAPTVCCGECVGQGEDNEEWCHVWQEFIEPEHQACDRFERRTP